MIGDIKNFIRGSYHLLHSKHLPRYFSDFFYRFIKCFNLKDMMLRFLCVAMRAPPIKGKLINMAKLYG